MEIHNEGLVGGMYTDAFVTLDGGYSYILNEDRARRIMLKIRATSPRYQFLMDIPEAELPTLIRSSESAFTGGYSLRHGEKSAPSLEGKLFRCFPGRKTPLCELRK